MTARRIVGLETEFGIQEKNGSGDVVEESNAVVTGYGAEGTATSRRGAIMWDYLGEDPLRDARGFHMDRSAADPSQLTDDPLHPAPSGAGNTIARPTAAQLAAPRTPNAVLRNGGRLYTDHAHPEYSSPETANPREAVLWDRAGEAIAQEAMEIGSRHGREFVLYKNNVDGKGAAYGSHENYLVERAVSFQDIIRYLTPFLVTRPLICGAGRVGLGQRSEMPGFQISQRADYIEAEVGLETTFNRPIINTRDEPHADDKRYRRLHVIEGDANLFDVSTLLKVGTTSLVLWLLEQDDVPLDIEAAVLRAPVPAAHVVSRDLTLSEPLATTGTPLTALDVQQIYHDAVADAIEENGGPDWDTTEILTRWQTVLDGLRTDIFSVARQVEWVAKYQLLSGLKERGGLGWDAPKLRAVDLQWHDLRPEHSLVRRLDTAGRVERLFTEDEVRWAVANPPDSTRAFLRGALVDRYPNEVVAGSWSEMILDEGGEELTRFAMPDPARFTRTEIEATIAGANSAGEAVHRLRH
ncbi:depupylase/deamidase Dop [Neoactinobaculum massilliense]|uniref:depupylase/deamidase Dop n=1 Tax=Neoactinobaculum massilliense TaxID=2364794 RepID=UPI000F51C8E2|nr:depupylase/deamidase Dop [Neoactinobaculum massilliense]